MLTVVALRRPGWLLAVSISGVFVYLLVLRLGGRTPHSRITAPYYVAVGGALAFVVWRRRDAVRSLFSNRIQRVWLAAAGFLAAWFVVNALLMGSGTTAARFAAILVLASVPTSALALTAGRRGIGEALPALVVIALAAVAADVVSLAAGTRAVGGRFSPFASLDPISAALVPAIGVLAAIALVPRTRLGLVARTIAIVLLVAAVVVPGSRGPIASLLIGAVALLGAQTKGGARVALATAASALVAGLGVGAIASDVAGTSTHWAHIGLLSHPPSVTATKPPLHNPTPSQKSSPAPTASATPVIQAGAIDSGRIRIEWAKEALRAVPNRPILGHGVAQLVDRTPEAYQMGIGGEHIWPHNDLIEAAFSLGIVGLVPFLVFLLVPAVVLIRRGYRAVPFAAGLLAFAFVESNLSGEIGTDVVLWTATAAALVAVPAVRDGHGRLMKAPAREDGRANLSSSE